MVHYIKIHGIKETFNDYKKIGMYIAFPICSLKCKNCQNENLKKESPIEVNLEGLVSKLLENSIIDSLILSGLNPFDSFSDMIKLIEHYREYSNKDIVIYTGYKEQYLKKEIEILKKYENIIVKFGEYIPNSKEVFDKVLGITLASENQYAKKIS